MSEPIRIYTSRSAAEKDAFCHRAGYYEYWYEQQVGPQGIVTTKPAFDRDFGQLMHDHTERLIQREPPEQVDLVARQAKETAIQLAQQCERPGDPHQWGNIAAGLLYAVHFRVIPRIYEEYELVGIESEFTVELGRWTASNGKEYVLIYQVKPDSLWRNRTTGALTYIELKTTGDAGEKWVRSWNRAVQLHTTMWAVGNKRNEPVEFAQVYGLYKGRKGYGKYQGEQGSIFARGWRIEGTPGVLDPRWDYVEHSGKGWARTPLTEYHLGIGHWVERMPTEILDEQLPMTPPIGLRPDIVQAFLRQLAYRVQAQIEARILIGQQPENRIQILDEVWPQTGIAAGLCEDAYGGDCDYLGLCWLPWMATDPLKTGQYRQRVPHHKPEVEALGSASSNTPSTN